MWHRGGIGLLIGFTQSLLDRLVVDLGFSLGLRKVCWIDLSWMWVSHWVYAKSVGSACRGCGFAQTLGWGRANPSVVDAGDVAVVSHGVLVDTRWT